MYSAIIIIFLQHVEEHVTVVLVLDAAMEIWDLVVKCAAIFLIIMFVLKAVLLVSSLILSLSVLVSSTNESIIKLVYGTSNIRLS